MEENCRIKFRNSFDAFGISYEENADLKTKTWIHRGGRVGFYVCPNTVDELKATLDICSDQGIAPIVVGHTSNIYFSNDFNPKVVITTCKLTRWEVKDDIIECEPGVNVKKLSSFCVESGFDGFYGLVDLPGTIAGAAVNNSSCFGCSISRVLAGCDFYENGVIHFLNEELEYSFRSSALKEKKLDGTILRVYLKVVKEDKNILSARAVAVRESRRRTQEAAAKNLGSTYAEIKYNSLSKVVLKVANIISRLFNVREKKMSKKLLLFVYGYQRLDNYISDFNLGCFVWRDGNADMRFEEYRRFIAKISISSILEIEHIRE